jgi:hypothetical protein
MNERTATTLEFMGYKLMEDFQVRFTDGAYTLLWLSDKPRPTDDDIAQQEQRSINASKWYAQSVARKDREAKAALALPDSDDPIFLRRKLNAALHLIQR